MRLCVIEFWISIFLVKFDSRNRQKVIDFSWKLGEVIFPSRFGTCLDINVYIYIYIYVHIYVRLCICLLSTYRGIFICSKCIDACVSILGHGSIIKLTQFTIAQSLFSQCSLQRFPTAHFLMDSPKAEAR